MKIGDVIDGKYLIVDNIGAGGMGTVLKVSSVADKTEFALKYCNDSDEAAIRRFKREVRIVSETSHANIVPILDNNLDHVPPYFIMPLARCSVEKIIATLKGNTDKIFALMDEICKGISAMHLSGHYHRDIKPSNILILENGQVVISDFGLAKKIIKDSSSHSSSNHFLGTFAYSAPEQVEAKNSDARTDVFQLGKTLYQLYTDEYPFLINPAKITAGLNYIIQKAIQVDPDDRYQSVGDFQQALNTYKLALDPTKNPKDAFLNTLNEINNLLQQNNYTDDTCIALLEILGKVNGDYDLFIELFDKIPTPILKILSSHLSKHFEPIFRMYNKNLNQYFENNHVDFSYAEVVANRMATIFHSTTKVEFKADALVNTLIAAVRCGRYRAMDTFDEMLQNVKEKEDALAISDVLRREITWYVELYDRIPRNKLHLLLQPIWDEAEKTKREEREKRAEELKKWTEDF